MTFIQQTFFFTIIILFSWCDGYSQQAFLSGTIKDKEKQPLTGATVAVLNMADSVLVTGGTADINGAFKIERLAPGNYLVKVSFVGYQDLYRPVTTGNTPTLLGEIILKERAQKLEEVLVEGKIPPAQQKGDTTLYNANAFKTNPDANAEDLVTKMPGVEMKEGKVQAQGEEVKTVLVDGKPYFGDDPNTVLKNIPAEVIDKIQVFDRKSDQSLFTGFDDGNSSKTINIVTKTQFRNGTFGKIFAGYGENQRYKTGATLNFFKNKRKITILAQANNINEQNFSTEDLAGVVSTPGNANRPGGQQGSPGGGGYRGGFGGGGGRQYGGQGNEVGNFLVNQNSGINTTNAVGVNYVNQWKKIDFTGSYFFNHTNNEAISNVVRNYSISKSEGLSYIESKNSKSNNMNHRLNVKFDFRIDSLRSLLIQPKVIAQINNGSNDISGNSVLSNINISQSQTSGDSKLTILNYSIPVLFKNAFHKKGRTLSLNLVPGYNTYDGESFLSAMGNAVADSINTDSIDQYSVLNKKGNNIITNLTYTEPVHEKLLLSISYLNNYNNQKSEKETFNKNEITGIYNEPEIFLTNQYNYAYLAQSLGAGIRFQQNNINLATGIAFQQSVSKNQQILPVHFQQTNIFYKWLPNAMLMVKFNEKKNLRINYRTSANPPAIEQLQNVINNTNPLQLTTGNPGLKEDLQHNLNLRYSAVNTDKNSSLFFLLGFSYNQNYIGTATLLALKKGTVINGYAVQEGAQISQPENFSQAYNIRSFVNYSFTFGAIKSNVNLSGGISYGVTPGSTNNQPNDNRNISPNMGVSITSNISKSIDFSISSNTSLTQTVNTFQSNLNSNYLNQTSKLKLNILPWKGLVLQSDLTHQYYSGLSENYNEKYFLWNAGIGYKFLKNQVAEIRASVYDILDQNKSITRNTTESYIEDLKTNVLQRYIMISFTYNLKFYKDTDKIGNFKGGVDGK